MNIVRRLFLLSVLFCFADIVTPLVQPLFADELEMPDLPDLPEDDDAATSDDADTSDDDEKKDSDDAKESTAGDDSAEKDDKESDTPVDTDLDEIEDSLASLDVDDDADDTASSDKKEDAAAEKKDEKPQEKKAFSATVREDGSLAITPGSGGALVKVGVDMAKRNGLVDEAKEVKETARQAVNRLEDHKSSQYASYLQLDTQLDAFYTKIGLSRGKLKEDVYDISEALVDYSLAGGSQSQEVRKDVLEQQKELRALGQELEAVSEKEQTVLKQLRALTDKVDAALDLILEVETLSSELRGLPTDAKADESMASIKEKSADIKKAEEAVEGEMSKKLEASHKAVKEAIASVDAKVAALKEKGLDFVAKAREILQDRERAPKMDVAPAPAKKQEEKKDQKKKEKPVAAHKKKKRSAKGRILQDAQHVASGIWGKLKSGFATVFGFAKKGAVSLADKVMGVEEEEDEKIQQVSASKAHQTPLDDPVLERIRIEREQAKYRMKSLFDQRKAIEVKESLLDRLEAERIMQMDRRSEVQMQLDKAYQRRDKELSWWDIGKRVMWKVSACFQRAWIRVRGWYGSKVRPRTTPKKQKKESAPAQQEGIGEQKVSAEPVAQPALASKEAEPDVPQLPPVDEEAPEEKTKSVEEIAADMPLPEMSLDDLPELPAE